MLVASTKTNFLAGSKRSRSSDLVKRSDIKRQAVAGTGNNTQVVPSDVRDRKTQQLSGGYTALTIRRRKSGYYYDKWKINDTRTDPRYPRPELKFFDRNIGSLTTPLSINSTGTFYDINTIPQGVGQNNRVGYMISNKSVYYQFVLNFGSTPVPTAIRHMLTYDRQSNQSAPTVANFLADPANPITSPLNDNYKARFIVLADDRTTLSPNGDNIRIISNFCRIPHHSVYSNPTDQPITGCISVLLVCDQPVGPTAPLIYGTWRLRFYDN